MIEFKNGVEELEKEHFDFIEAELAVSADEIFEFSDERRIHECSKVQRMVLSFSVQRKTIF